jgi:hypothetical protein
MTTADALIPRLDDRRLDGLAAPDRVSAPV